MSWVSTTNLTITAHLFSWTPDVTYLILHNILYSHLPPLILSMRRRVQSENIACNSLLSAYEKGADLFRVFAQWMVSLIGKQQVKKSWWCPKGTAVAVFICLNKCLVKHFFPGQDAVGVWHRLFSASTASRQDQWVRTAQHGHKDGWEIGFWGVWFKLPWIHPGRLTFCTYKSPMKRKENDLPNLYDYVPC